jgi:hypothetical protein
MNDAKYIGMDVHQATISVAVGDSRGNLVTEATLEIKTETIVQFLQGIRGSLHVTFEEGADDPRTPEAGGSSIGPLARSGENGPVAELVEGK